MSEKDHASYVLACFFFIKKTIFAARLIENIKYIPIKPACI